MLSVPNLRMVLQRMGNWVWGARIEHVPTSWGVLALNTVGTTVGTSRSTVSTPRGYQHYPVLSVWCAR